MIDRAKADRVQPKSVGVWIRVSTDDQAKGESPEHHRKRAEMYAESKGWQIARLYDLSGVSGKSILEHPETKAMLSDVASGKIGGLVFSKLARLARNTKELLEIAEFFEKHGASLVSLGESIDTSTPAGRLFYTIIAAMAQWEREEISSRVREAVKVRAKLGKILGGAAPFGYRRSGSTLVPDGKEAPIRRLVYDLFLEHRRLKTVAALLNKAGYRTRRGTPFSDSVVRWMLEDPVSKGQKRVNYTRRKPSGKGQLIKSRDEWVMVELEPIVPPDLWDACNAILATRKTGPKPAKHAVHLFTGLAFCACGGRMRVEWKSPNYVCGKCRRKIGINDLEAVFRDQLRSFYQSPDEVRAYLEAGREDLSEKRRLLAALEAERAAVQSNLDKTYQLYLDGVISSAGFGTRYHPLEERFRQLAEEIPKVQGEADYLAIEHLSSEEIVSEAQDVYGRWDTLDTTEKRAVVEAVVERVVIKDDTVSIDLFGSPAPSQTAAVGQRTASDPRR